ncbi:interleukin-1 receptor-associated kinase 1 [Diretmus argenteus]
MSGRDFRDQFLYQVPAAVLWRFSQVMDELSDPDWTRFASEVLSDQTSVRLAERRERRTDWVMNQWGSRNGRVGELVDLLEQLQLLRARDIILGWSPGTKPSSSPPPPPPPPAVTPTHDSKFDPPPKPTIAPPPLPTRILSTAGGGARVLPKPGPPPTGLQSRHQDPPPQSPDTDSPVGSSGVMCWSYEEVHAGTEGFCPTLQIGEGGFGNVYRASMRNTVYAIKRLKQDSPLDWSLVKESFKTEVEKLSKFRHPNIVDLLGFSVGGAFCLIYSYMDNRSLEDQLHTTSGALSWPQRVSVVEGASRGLQFLHFPPQEHSPLIHGDIKSSNILLDQFLVAKLGDFGLARFGRRPAGRSSSQTASIGKTATVRGTLAYLPDEYVDYGELGTAIDVYSFGVVLLEVLTGRRALEIDGQSRATYLKDLVLEVEDASTSQSSSPAALLCRTHLDQNLTSPQQNPGAAEPAGCLDMAALACRCLDKRRKKRPPMTAVFDKLQDIHNILKKTNSCIRGTASPPPRLHHHPQSFPRPPQSRESSMGALSQEMSRLGPLEDTYQPLFSSASSSSTSSSLTPLPLHSSSSSLASSSSHPSLSSSSLPTSSSSSFAGPCESDESQGFSQYNAPSQIPGPSGNQYWTHQGNYQEAYERQGMNKWTNQGTYQGPVPGSSAGIDPGLHQGMCGTSGAFQGNYPGLYGIPEGPSPAGSLRSSSPGPSVQMNPHKQRLLVKKSLYEEGRIQTPELLSADDPYADRVSGEIRGPEESDELDYLPVQPNN